MGSGPILFTCAVPYCPPITTHISNYMFLESILLLPLVYRKCLPFLNAVFLSLVAFLCPLWYSLPNMCFEFLRLPLFLSIEGMNFCSIFQFITSSGPDIFFRCWKINIFLFAPWHSYERFNPMTGYLILVMVKKKEEIGIWNMILPWMANLFGNALNIKQISSINFYCNLNTQFTSQAMQVAY